MKKIALIGIILFVAVGLYGCGGSKAIKPDYTGDAAFYAAIDARIKEHIQANQAQITAAINQDIDQSIEGKINAMVPAMIEQAISEIDLPAVEPHEAVAPMVMQSAPQGQTDLFEQELEPVDPGFSDPPDDTQIPTDPDEILEAPILFDSGFTLSPDAQALILEKARVLNRPQYDGALYSVDGHSSKSGDPDKNEELSLKRAQVVAILLAFHGVPNDRLKIVARGAKRAFFGDPLKNQRVTFNLQ
jgi:outer membrane protein OmpA-like peptidoglycan-associated protein